MKKTIFIILLVILSIDTYALTNNDIMRYYSMDYTTGLDGRTVIDLSNHTNATTVVNGTRPLIIQGGWFGQTSNMTNSTTANNNGWVNSTSVITGNWGVNRTRNFSISFWLKINGPTNIGTTQHQVFMHSVDAANLDIINIVQYKNNLSARYYQNGAPDLSVGMPSDNMNTSWNLIVLTYEFNGTQTLRFYKNTTKQAGNFPVAATTRNQLEIGDGQLTPTINNPNMMIDEFAIYNKTLDSSEINSIWVATVNPFVSGFNYPVLSNYNVTSNNVFGNSTVWNNNLTVNITSNLLSFTLNTSINSNCSAVLDSNQNYSTAIANNSNYKFATTNTISHAYTVFDNISVGNHCLYVHCVDSTNANADTSSGCLNVTRFNSTINLSMNNFTKDIKVEIGSLINISSNMLYIGDVCINFNHPSYGINYSCNSTFTSFIANISYFRNTVFNDSSTSKNLSFTGNQNLSFGITANAYDDIVDLKVNFTTITNTTDVSGLLVYINNTLSNNISLVSASSINQFYDGTTFKDVGLNSEELRLVSYFYLPKLSTITNAKIDINGTSTLPTQYGLPNSSYLPYVVIKALSLTESAFNINDCKIKSFVDDASGNTYWVVWDNVSTDSYEVKRAKVYNTIFFSGATSTMNSVSVLATTDATDVGYKAYVMTAWVSTTSSGTTTYISNFTVNSSSKTSVWFDGYAQYTYGKGFMGIDNQIFDTPDVSPYSNSTLNTDQSSYELYNTSGIKVEARTTSASVGYATITAFYLTTLNIGQLINTVTYVNTFGCPSSHCGSSYQDISTTYSLPALSYWQENYSTTNPYLIVGTLDGHKDWNYTGVYTGLNTTNNFNDSINNYLVTCTEDDDGYCFVPIYMYSLYDGGIRLQNIILNVTIDNNPITLNHTLIQNYLTDKSGFVNVPITIHSNTAGILNVNDIKFDYLGGNKTYTITAHDTSYVLNQSYNITYYFTKWNYTLPNNIDYIEFLPKSQTSKNVTPFKQTNTTPIMNITMKNYGGPGNFSIYLNESFSCINISYNFNGDMSQKTLWINSSWINIKNNMNSSDNFGIWLYLDYNCTFTNGWNLWYPDMYFRGCYTNTDICSTELI